MSKYSSNGYYIDHKKLLRDLDEADKRKIKKIIKTENNLFGIEDERSRRLRNRSSSPTRKMRESPRRVRNRSSSPTRKMRESPRRIKYTENELRLMDELERCREEVNNLKQIIQNYQIGINKELVQQEQIIIAPKLTTKQLQHCQREIDKLRNNLFVYVPDQKIIGMEKQDTEIQHLYHDKWSDFLGIKEGYSSPREILHRLNNYINNKNFIEIIKKNVDSPQVINSLNRLIDKVKECNLEYEKPYIETPYSFSDSETFRLHRFSQLDPNLKNFLDRIIEQVEK
jgi:hypothetical protein